MRDYADKNWIRRPLWTAFKDWLMGIDPDPGMPLPETVEPSADTADYMRAAKLTDASSWLGKRWRARPDCTHQYTNSLGIRCEP